MAVRETLTRSLPKKGPKHGTYYGEGYPTKPFPILGARPAGLACAITLARAGRQVVVYDCKREAGARFHDDFQGIENWTSKDNILQDLRTAGIEINIEHQVIESGTAYDAWGRAYDIESSAPLYYLVRRGRGGGTLDVGFLGLATGIFSSTALDDLQ